MLEDDLKLQSKFDAFYHHPALNGISDPSHGFDKSLSPASDEIRLI